MIEVNFHRYQWHKFVNIVGLVMGVYEIVDFQLSILLMNFQKKARSPFFTIHEKDLWHQNF